MSVHSKKQLKATPGRKGLSCPLFLTDTRRLLSSPRRNSNTWFHALIKSTKNRTMLVQNGQRRAPTFPTKQRIGTRMPTQRKLRRHCAIPPAEKDKPRSRAQKSMHANTPTPPSRHHARAHLLTTPTSPPIERHPMVHQTLRRTPQTNPCQTKSTKNTTSHHTPRTCIHTPEINADKPGNNS